MAGIYNGHILEFPLIRVDCFTVPPPPSTPARWLLPDPYDLSAPSLPAPNAQLFLLTHVHSDHLLGLSETFTGKIVCTPDTKRMLLRLEAEVQREYVHEGLREGPGKRKYAGLKARTEVTQKGKKRVVDLIEAVPYGDPRVYELGYDEHNRPIRVTITLLDANHCPGSAMFLIESDEHAVLHTGDIRADTPFLDALRNNPAVGQYIEPWAPLSVPGSGGAGCRQLDRIYLDTSAVLGTGDMPDREPVLRDLIQQMRLYPEDTVFFLNVWCFGWEHVVKEVARHFHHSVHVDRYKASIYSAVKTDPFLSACTTSDPLATRLHACERRFRCKVCRTFNKRGDREWNVDKRIVTVNMVEIKTANWDMERSQFAETLAAAASGEGPWPYTMNCPIARHSTLPELQRLVRLFRPRSISPNTMVPDAKGMDFYLLPDLFEDCLGLDGYENVVRERDEWFASQARFGKAWLQRIYGAQTQTEHSIGAPEMGRGRRQAGRRSNAQDQISRLSRMPDAQLLQLVTATGASPDVLTTMMMDPGGLAAPMPLSSAAGGLADPDYDTDEENGRRRKRRRAQESLLSDSPLDVKPGTGCTAKAESPTDQHHRMASTTPVDIKIEADIKPRTNSSAYSVDQHHLRSLMAAT